MSAVTPNIAAEAAEAAHNEVTRVAQTVQDLLDAVQAGKVVSEGDLRMLRKDMGVLRFAVARTFHATSHVSRDRRELAHG